MPSTEADASPSTDAGGALVDAAEEGSLPAASGDVSAVAAPLLALLARPEGAALRRLAHRLDAHSLLRRLTALAAAGARRGTTHDASSVALKSALRLATARAVQPCCRLLRLPSQPTIAEHAASSMPVARPLADSPRHTALFSPYPVAKPDGSERRARRVRRFLLRAHLSRLLSTPRGALDLVSMVAALAAFSARCAAADVCKWLGRRVRWVGARVGRGGPRAPSDRESRAGFA
jgi:hypothetical protein